MPARFDMYSRISWQKEVGPDTFLLRLHVPEIAGSAKPGQFVMIKSCGEEEHDPLLRRPFSIHRVDAEDEAIEILYRVTGRGTRLMAVQEEGSFLKVLGPLGMGFGIRERKIPILVGGGLGIAPLLFLADFLREEKGIVVLGAITRGQLFRLGAFAGTGLDVIIATEDGSFGNRGLVTEVLDRLLRRLEGDARKNITVFSCGPMPMLSAVARLCGGYDVECQVSLEAFMACGLGLCLGCAVKARAGGYLHVCKEGPVFSSRQIDWSEI